MKPANPLTNKTAPTHSSLLERSKFNPILSPKLQDKWQSLAVFNPSAIYLNGRVHLLYRAFGNEYISVLGYASSNDGETINEILPAPVFSIERCNASQSMSEFNTPSPSATYTSGMSRCGVEDPRMVAVEDTLYMTYTAYDGWSAPGVGLTSIKIDDFLNHRWNWKQPILISEPHSIHKNWVIFPEKINGKYALLHSITPEIQIKYFDSLDFKDGDFIQSLHSRAGRSHAWDNWTRGAAAPPIRTKKGWLLLYHAMDKQDPDKYKLGAMILDINNPTKILFRKNTPALEPSTAYEREGFKSGVIYCCGAVVRGDNLYVYYGAADTVCCVATVNLDAFLDSIEGVNTVSQKK